MEKRSFVSWLTGLFVVGFAAARLFGAPATEPRFASVFGDHMVLQRDRPVPVWGTAKPGERVAVSFGDQTVRTTTDAQGAWKVALKPLKASRKGRVLRVGKTELQDVVVGEVWFASGQSNMACPLIGPMTRFRDCAGGTVSRITRRSFVRYVTVPTRAELKACGELAKPAEWVPCVPENLTAKPVSAVAFYFATALAEAVGVPVGVVNCSCGGTNIDAWTPRCGTASRPDLKDLADWAYVPAKDWKPAKEYKLPIDGFKQQPAVLWNGTVAPFAPMAMRGMVWYQGERNAAAGAAETARYCSKLHALFNGWAKEFGNPDMKLHLVQLCPWGIDISAFQLEQQRFCDEHPGSRLAIVNDLGNLKDIHPHRKQLVGMRLALLAMPDCGYDPGVSFPRAVKFRVEGEEGVVTVAGAEKLYYYSPERTLCEGFELAGADGRFVKAEIVNADNTPGAMTFGAIKGREIRLKAAGVASPVKVRYLFARPWYGAVRNEADLPLGAFSLTIR